MHNLPAHLPYLRRSALPMPRGVRKKALKLVHRVFTIRKEIQASTTSPTSVATFLANIQEQMDHKFCNDYLQL